VSLAGPFSRQGEGQLRAGMEREGNSVVDSLWVVFHVARLNHFIRENSGSLRTI
jgi:hypothetical protein